MAHAHPSKNSLANLKPITTRERALELGARGNKVKAQRKIDAAQFNADLSDSFTSEMEVPASLREGLKKFGIEVKKKERMHKVVTYRALLKAIKDGNIDPLLKLADFAGFSFSKKGLLEISAEGDININVRNVGKGTQNEP